MQVASFWLNPTNPQTRGVRPAEIRQLFPGCSFKFERITLAPPITRRLARIGKLDLLHLLYGELLIPQAVWNEVVVKG